MNTVANAHKDVLQHIWELCDEGSQAPMLPVLVVYRPNAV